MKRIRILIFGNNGFKWQPMVIDRSEWLVQEDRTASQSCNHHPQKNLTLLSLVPSTNIALYLKHR